MTIAGNQGLRVHPGLKASAMAGTAGGGSGGGVTTIRLVNPANETLHSGTTFTRSSAGSRFNSSGVLVSETTNTPRWDYNPVTDALKGLLIEESRQNAHTFSDAADNAVWTKTRTSITANNTTSPDGTSNADKVVEDSSASTTHLIFRTRTYNTGVSYSSSWFVKAAERSVVNIRYTAGAFGANVEYSFNLSTGVATEVTPGTSSGAIMEALGDGWYRCGIFATATATAVSGFNLYLNNGSGISYTGNGSSGVYVFRANGETGTRHTSTIGTTTTAVTRSSDEAIISDLSDISFNADSGGIVFEGFTPRSVVETSCAFSFNNGSDSDSIRLIINSSASLRFQVIVGGVFVANLGLGTVTPSTSIRVAASWEENNITASLNGGTPVTDTSATIPTVDRLMIGRQDSGSYWNGQIKELTYYP